MSYLASSTKERFDELQKNPLVFCKFGTVNVQDDMGYNHATEGWSSCDPTIKLIFYEKDLPHNNQTRQLFRIGKQLFPNGKIDEKKEGKDIVDFEILEFDYDKVSDWILVINDCLYNYRSGNSRHCHMALRNGTKTFLGKQCQKHQLKLRRQHVVMCPQISLFFH